MRYRGWRTCFALSFCLVAAGLGTAPAARAGDPPSPSGPHFPAIASLNLTPAQQQKMTDLGNWSQGQAKGLYDQVHKLRDRLSDLYGSYVLDAAEARRLNGELNRVQGQLLALHLNEQQQMRAILTPVQFAQLQTALRQQDGWRKHMHGPPDHGPQDTPTHKP